MFVRAISLRGIRYLQVVESYRQGGVSRHRVLVALGRCGDEAREQQVRGLIKDYRPLSRAQVIIAEVGDASGPIQGKGYFKKLRGWR